MQKVRRFVKLIEATNEWVGKILAPLVVVMGCVMVWEVLLRYGFNRPTFWAHETTQFIFGAYFVLGGGYTLLHRGHVNMDVLYGRFPPRTKAFVDLITSVILFFFLVVLLWKGVEMAWTSVQIWERSHTPFGPPLWPIKLTVPIAAVLFLIQGLAKFISDLFLALTGKELHAENGLGPAVKKGVNF